MPTVVGVGQQLVEQIDLIGNGREVRSAGDVAAGRVVGVNQAALRIVGDGGTHHGNVGGGAGDRLRGGRGDGKDQSSPSFTSLLAMVWQADWSFCAFCWSILASMPDSSSAATKPRWSGPARRAR